MKRMNQPYRVSKKTRLLQGVRVLVTAGPTVEDIDPVRFISNRSSGRMGVAVARAAREMGARVVLVHGPLVVPVPSDPRIRCVLVRSAADMYRAVLREVDKVDVLVMAAAVADFTPVRFTPHKIKKGTAASWVLRLRRTPDILKAVGNRKSRPVLVGFAAETKHVVAEARRKLLAKHCDMICANDVGERGSGFGVATNRVTMIHRDGRVVRGGRQSKLAVARRLLREAARYLA